MSEDDKKSEIDSSSELMQWFIDNEHKISRRVNFDWILESKLSHEINKDSMHKLAMQEGNKSQTDKEEEQFQDVLVSIKKRASLGHLSLSEYLHYPVVQRLKDRGFSVEDLGAFRSSDKVIQYKISWS